LATIFEKQVQELYIAYFGRAADPEGLNFYAGSLSRGETTIEDIASSFSNAKEAQSIVVLSTADFLNVMYQQAFSRAYNSAPDKDGLFWANAIDTGATTKVLAMVQILKGAPRQSDDAKAVENKVNIANKFTDAVHNTAKAYVGSGVTASAKAVLDSVNSNAVTVTAALAKVRSVVDDMVDLSLFNPEDIDGGSLTDSNDNDLITTEEITYTSPTSTETSSALLPSNTLIGTTGNDRLEGDASNEVLIGGDGNDILRGGGGIDDMHGGDGDDRFVIVGDISGGGKVDSIEDTDVLGFPLTDMNFVDLNEDADGAAEVIDGGTGNDTLYVYGTADLSNYTIRGIEHIEIRSDVIFTEKLFDQLKSLTGDGSSTLRIKGGSAANPYILDLTKLDSVTLQGIGQIELGEHVVLKISSLDQLGGSRIFTGAGSIKGAAGEDITLPSNYTLGTDFKVLNTAADNSETSAAGLAQVLDRIIKSKPGTLTLGTSGDDYIQGTEAKDTLDGKDGNDVLSGAGNDDIFKVSGSGTKIIIDRAGIDTLDLSDAKEKADINLSTGGTIGNDVNTPVATIKLGAGNAVGATAKDAAKSNVMIIFDVSGSMRGQRLIDAKNAAIELLEAYKDLGELAVRLVEFDSSATSTFSGVDSWLDIDTAKTIINSFSVKGTTNYGAALDKAESAFVSGNDLAYFSQGVNTSYFLSDGKPNSSILSRENDWENFLIEEQIISHAIGFGGLNSTNEIEPIAFDGTKVKATTDDHTPGEINATLSTNSNDLAKTLVSTVQLDFIENVIGTDFGDELTGNSLDNIIEGLDGKDTLTGLGGDDTLKGGIGDQDVAVFSGNKDDYKITVSGAGLIVEGIQGAGLLDGRDTINGIEYLHFSDTPANELGVLVKDYFPVKPAGVEDKFSSKVSLLADFAYAAYRNTPDKIESYDALENDGWVFLGKDTLGYNAPGIISGAKGNKGNAISLAETLPSNIFSAGETKIGSVVDFFDTPTGDTFPVYGDYNIYYETGGTWIDSNADGQENSELNGFEIHGSAAAIVAVKGDSLVLSFRGTEDVMLSGELPDSALPLARGLMNTILSKDDRVKTITDYTENELQIAADTAFLLISEIADGFLDAVPLSLKLLFPKLTAAAYYDGSINALASLKGVDKDFLMSAVKTPENVISDTDSAGWVNPKGHYDKFSPLIESINKYIEDQGNGISKLYVTGHSLGAGMASWYLTDANKGGAYLQKQGIDVFGASFAAPGIITTSDVNTKELAPGTEYYRFEVAKDVVPDTGDIVEKVAPTTVPHVSVVNPGKQINLTTTENTISATIDAYKKTIDLHGMDNYKNAIAMLNDSGILDDIKFLEHNSPDLFKANDLTGRYDPIIMTLLDPLKTTSTGDISGSLNEWVYAEKYSNNDIIIGTTNNDTLIANNAANLGVLANSGLATNDIFYLGAGGNDTVYGGTKFVDNGGIDTVIYNFDLIDIDNASIVGKTTINFGDNSPPFSHTSNPGIVDKDKNTVKVNLDGSEDTVVDIEQFHFIDAASDDINLLVGTNGTDNLDALAGNDYLFGAAGDDFLTGGSGNDRIHGGIGNDTAIFSDNFNSYDISVENWSLKVSNIATGETDYLYDIEMLQFNDSSKETYQVVDGLSESLEDLYAPIFNYKDGDADNLQVFVDEVVDPVSHKITALHYELREDDTLTTNDHWYMEILLGDDYLPKSFATLVDEATIGFADPTAQVRLAWDSDLIKTGNHLNTYLDIDAEPLYLAEGHITTDKVFSQFSGILSEGFESTDFDYRSNTDLNDDLAESVLYEMDGVKDANIKLVGLNSGQMEMGFLFYGTSIAQLGHFDLV